MAGLNVRVERFPIAGTFTIARGSRIEANVVVAEIVEDGCVGRGECVPYARYGETIDSVVSQIETARRPLAQGLTRRELDAVLPPGAARNALDCAFWDLEAKRTGQAAHRLAGLPEPGPLTTAFTISVDTPANMAAATAKANWRPLLKIKLAGGEEDLARLRAVRGAAPAATLIVDANEAWSPADLDARLEACHEAGVALVEQPLPADNDEALRGLRSAVPICADESIHCRADLAGLRSRYDAVNIKLDKTGGLTEALATIAEARELGFDIMVGCMVATSLAMAPAMLAAQAAHFVDLDGPLLLAADRPNGLRFEGSTIYPPEPMLWG